MDIERIKQTLELIISRAENPLYNPLETGFRHSPLSVQETIKRYKEFSEEVFVDCNAILRDINS